MVALADPPRVTRAFGAGHVAAPDVAIPVAGAALGAMLVMLACLVVPTRLLEALVVRSGVAALVNAAAPPLGFTARLLLAAGSGLLAGAVGWALLVLVVGERRIALRRPAWRLPARPRVRHRPVATGPSIRRADSHPDAPPRPPILAGRELGLPFLSIVAPAGSAAPMPASDERPLPIDLDTALAAIDPAAIPDVPREPMRAVASLAAPPPAHHPVPLAPGERIDSVELGADVRARQDSIEALLARLERGTRRRPAPSAEPVPAAALPVETTPTPPLPSPSAPPAPPASSSGSLAETLGQLRRLAIRS